MSTAHRVIDKIQQPSIKMAPFKRDIRVQSESFFIHQNQAANYRAYMGNFNSSTRFCIMK